MAAGLKFHERFVKWTLVSLTVAAAIATFFGGAYAFMTAGILEGLKTVGAGIIGTLGLSGMAHLYSEHTSEEK